MNNETCLTYSRGDYRWIIQEIDDGYRCELRKKSGPPIIFTRASIEGCQRCVDLFVQPVNEPERGRIEK